MASEVDVLDRRTALLEPAAPVYRQAQEVNKI